MRRDLTPALGVALGLAFFAAVLLFNYQDFHGIGAIVERAPLGLVISLLVHVPQICLTALAWRTLLPGALRPALATMVVLRWIRESMNALVPAGAIIGQAVAARRLARDGMPADIAAATATVDMTVEGATQGVFTLAGLLLLLTGRSDLHVVRIIGIGIGIAAAASVAMVVAQRHLPVRALETLIRRVPGRWLALRSGWLADFQAGVLRLHADRRALAAAASFHLTAWALGAVEIAGIVHLFGRSITLRDGFVVESLTQAFRSAAFIIPGALGVQEGAIIASCALIGVPPDIALALALLRRAREVLIGLPGLLVWRRLGARVPARE